MNNCCGEKPIIVQQNETHEYMVWCLECNKTSDYGKTQEQAIDNWNSGKVKSDDSLCIYLD